MDVLTLIFNGVDVCSTQELATTGKGEGCGKGPFNPQQPWSLGRGHAYGAGDIFELRNSHGYLPEHHPGQGDGQGGGKGFGYAWICGYGDGEGNGWDQTDLRQPVHWLWKL